MITTSRLVTARLAARWALVFLAAPFIATSAAGQTSHAIKVGAATGYTDVSPKQVVRTSGNIAYLIATNCDSYPCTSPSQTVRVWKGNSAGVPTTFTRKDSAREPSDTSSVAAAIDGSDTIHIVWQDRNGASNTRIRYSTFNTTTDLWGTPEDVEGNVGAAEDSGQGDSFVALALDANGKPHVAYLFHDGTRRRLAYKNRVSGGWSARTFIDDNAYGTNEKAWVPNIAFDTAGRRVFAWLTGAFNGETDGVIRVRVMDLDGTLGTRADVSTATAKVGIDQSTSLLCDGKIHIAWILGGAPGNEFVRYASATESKNPTFVANHPANADTHNPSIAPGGAGTIRIYGHGSESPNNDSIFYWEGTGGGGAWSARTLYATGSFDASVSARWSQYFHNHPLTLDIAYWDQNYPNDLYYGADVIAGCAATVAPTAQTFVSTGGTGTVAVTVSAGCAWTAASNVSWITVTAGASGSGNGTVAYSVAANTTGPTRTGTLTIASQTVTVTQAGKPPTPPTNLRIVR
jgi:hypothetical protein